MKQIQIAVGTAVSVNLTASGLFDFGARTYLPERGRFTQLDPLPASVTDLNRHAYAGDNPTNFIDPTGLSHCDASTTIAAGLVGFGSTIGASILIGGTIISGGILAPLTSAPSIGAASIATGSNIVFLGCIHFPFFGG